MLSTHYTLYKITKIILNIFLVIIIVGSIVGAIICFANQIPVAALIALGSGAVLAIVLYLLTLLLGALMNDIYILTKTINTLSKKEKNTELTVDKLKAKEEASNNNNQQPKETKEEKKEQPVKKETSSKQNQSFKLDDIIVVKYDVTKNDKLIKKGTIGRIDNYLYGSMGKSYVIYFEGSDEPYRFAPDEIELK